MRPPPIAAAAAAVALVIGGVGAQDDLRDVVTLKSGRVVRGRVVDRYDPKEILLVQGGKRVRIRQEEVKSLDTVLDRLRELMQRRAALQDNVTYRWILAEWASVHDLPAMARLLALDVVLADPDHEVAHEMLGHREVGGRWLWPLKDRQVPFDDLRTYHAEWGHPLELASEHFRIRSDAGLRPTIDALFDLERLYVWWFDTFGARLRLHAVLEPLELQVWRDPAEFPAWSSLRLPYFRVAVESPIAQPAAGYTYYDTTERPEDLFQIATQHLLYTTLADAPVLSDVRDRLCAWAEIGFGQWVESGFTGPPGHAEPVEPRLPQVQARFALDRRAVDLDTLTHLQATTFYVAVSDATLVHQASAHAFVAFLMAKEPRARTRDAFLDYLSEALRGGKGDSSSTLDRALGQPVQTLREPYRQWLGEVARGEKRN